MKVRTHETALVEGLRQGIQICLANGLKLPGIQDPVARDVFLSQLVDSIRRVKYVSTIASKDIHPSRADGTNPLFDPLKAAILHVRQGQIDEACWLVFLFVHFGSHPKSGWRYAREVYSANGVGQGWTWARVSANPESFRDWLRNNEAELTRGKARGFGNHRKYLSMSADKSAGTGAAVVSYVNWVMQAGSHQALFQSAIVGTGGLPEHAFKKLYLSMSMVRSFGRMGRFDYLTMIAKLGISNIKPGSAYISGSTGPQKGAREMFQDNDAPRLSVSELDQKMIQMGCQLNVGLQEMEDSICNWQKSPMKYKFFNG